VDRVDRDPADAEILIEILVSRDVAPATLQAQFHVQLAALGDRGDVRLGLENLDIRITLDVLRADHTRLLHAQVQRLRVVDVHLERDLLQIEDDVGRVLDDARDGRELVEHAVNLHRRDRGALDRREQHAPQRIADGGTEAALERLRVEPTEPIRERLPLELEPFRTLKTFPEHHVFPFANGPAAPASRPASYVRRPPAAGL
jgi:hypothetical protein